MTRVIVLVLAAAIQAGIPVITLAQDAQNAPQPTLGGMVARMGIMFVMVYLVFHLLVIKPKKIEMKKQQELLTGLKKGEQVVTSSGLLGKVAGVEKDFVLLEIAPNVRVKIEISHITRKLDRPVQEKAA